MQPPSRWLAPGAGTAMLPPPPGRQEASPGDQRAPPTPPPPLPLRPKSGRRQTEETAAPHPPRRGRCTQGAGAPRPRQAPTRPACCRPTADRRRPGGRKRCSLIRGRPGEDGGANQGEGSPPPPPRRTDLSAADRTAPDARGRRQPPRHEYTPGGHAWGNGRQADARQGHGGGGGGASPPPRPPQLEGHRSSPPPPRSRGDAPPPPPEGTATRGRGGDAAGPAPAGVAAAGRAHDSVPEQRTQRNSMGAAPNMTLQWPQPTQGGQRGGSGQQGPPGSGPRAAPHPPPPRGGTATQTARARLKGVRRRHEGGQD